MGASSRGASHMFKLANLKSSHRGRNASKPTKIPFAGWWDITSRLHKKLQQDNTSILSAGVAFYAVLAVFPALAAIVTLYALVANPDNIQNHLKAVSGFIPEEVILIFSDQVGSIAAANETLGLSFIAGLLVATWSAHRGVDALVRAITVAYLEKETRGIIRRNVITYLLTIGAVLCTVFILTLMIGIPALFVTLKLPHWITVMTGIGVWILFLSVAILAISIQYRFGPPRRPANWRWLSPGAMAATLLWLCGSAGFSYYVSQFGTYNETYGALSAIVVLLIWFYLTSYAIVLGASLNAEIEHQTRHDTTVGDQRPMGQRDAYVADHLGQSATDG